METTEMKPKTEVNYKQATDLITSCGSCASFVSPNACKLVRGPISSSMTCDMFTAADSDEAPTEAPA